MPSLSGYFQRLLHNHSKFVDFVSASVIISLCLILLLPKVHNSFLEEDKDDNSTHGQPEYLNQQLPLDNNGEPPTVTTIVGNLDQVVVNQDHDHNHGHHHHDHKLPMGELIICIGFFAFYCIGLGLSKTRNFNDLEPLLAKERKTSTNCCSSTRCPSSREQETQFVQGAATSIEVKAAIQEQFPDVGSKFLDSTEGDDECVFTLNRHHNHHTHNRHHEHQPNQKLAKIRENNYGAISRAQTLPELNVDQETIPQVRRRANQIYVEEISITTRSLNEESLGWPLSIKVTSFGLLLIAVLLVFDMNINGFIESIKVFRAAATGALLYVAFFLVLPKSSAGCNSCSKEEV